MKIERPELARRAEAAMKRLGACDICPNACGVDRLAGQVGFCGAGAGVRVASWNLHHGEEPPISGTKGSGTIFFSHCTMKCAYCQNWPISQLGNGQTTDSAGLARMMLELKRRGAHNINFVTPTHYMPYILAALVIAADDGFDLPLVYNTSGWEVMSALELLDGVVDIYLPDIRYADDALAMKYSKARNYTRHNRAAVTEMFRQVGLLETGEDGMARRGMIIRHLVLPDGISGTEEVMKFLSGELSRSMYISLMDQYFPAHRALDIPELSRKITADEYRAAQDIKEKYRLFEGWEQEHD
ncbi:MAG TPA: radical SAM protein [Nitrospirota bacterium]